MRRLIGRQGRHPGKKQQGKEPAHRGQFGTIPRTFSNQTQENGVYAIICGP
jgi:hypothetical protein